MQQVLHLSEKINILVQEIHKKNADALVLNSFQNRFWLLNFSSSDGFVIVDKNGIVNFFIDGRYHSSAQQSLSGIEKVQVHLLRSFNDVKEYLLKHNLKHVLLEDIYTTANIYLLFQSFVQTSLFSAAGIRIIKFEDEIINLQKAADIAVATFEYIREFAVPGKTEKEIANAATVKMLELGASKNSFDPIVASGPNGANAHHKPTDRVICANELITLDLGCIYNNYCSDMTRTWAVNNTQLSPELQKMHDSLFAAQEKGLKAAIAGNNTFAVDAACRDALVEDHYDKYFIHSTGHGLGIDVHELPNVNSNQKTSVDLVNNMVITVEPGIYIPGFGGLRIEDSVVIYNNNPIVLTGKACRKSNW